jgi:hypothetical protein
MPGISVITALKAKTKKGRGKFPPNIFFNDLIILPCAGFARLRMSFLTLLEFLLTSPDAGHFRGDSRHDTRYDNRRRDVRHDIHHARYNRSTSALRPEPRQL